MPLKKHVLDTIRPVTPDDYPEISSWLRARGQSGLAPQFMPPQGFIAPGVACGFMITTNTSVAILEHFVSNLEAPKLSRGQALKAISEKLIAAGQGSGIRLFMAMTRSEAVNKLCEMNGFKQQAAQTVWAKGS